MRGGYRKNAGRKKGFSAISAEQSRIILADMVAREIVPIAEALILKAKNGDISAVKELFDRAWGRSPQAMSIRVTDNEPYPGDANYDNYLNELATKMSAELKKVKTN